MQFKKLQAGFVLSDRMVSSSSFNAGPTNQYSHVYRHKKSNRSVFLHRVVVKTARGVFEGDWMECQDRKLKHCHHCRTLESFGIRVIRLRVAEWKKFRVETYKGSVCV